jgi:ABC-type microcin C transport system duplicated ATPase subunit YejF
MADEPQRVGETTPQASVLLAARDLTLRYVRRKALAGTEDSVVALQGVSLELHRGRTLALVGASGSGKSSLARCLVLLERPDAGDILYAGKNLLALDRREQKAILRDIHLIFQDSAAALSPGLRVADIIAEPLSIHEPELSRADKRRRILDVVSQAGMSEKWLSRRPLELSGGQRQRVAIARALVARPKVFILDEALASLDLSTQNQIANLLLDLQHTHSLTYLFITHDLALAGALADRVAVLQAGRIVRQGPTRDVLLTANLQGAAPALRTGAHSRETVVAN